MRLNGIRTLWFLWLGTSLILSGCSFSNQDADADAEAEAEAESIAITLWTEQFELFMEYPQLQVGVPARFAAHLTDLKTFQPVTQGPVVFEFIGERGVVKTVTEEEPTQPGIFVPEVIFEAPGEFTLRVHVQDPSSEGQIEVQSVIVYPLDTDVPPIAESEFQGDPVTYLKEQQWKLPFRAESAAEHLLAGSLSATGRILPKPNWDALIVPPVPGQFLPSENGLAVLGQSVRKGQLLGWIEHPLPAAEQTAMGSAQVQTGVSLAEFDERIAQAEARSAQAQSTLELARQEDARVRRLHAIEVVPERRLELATNELVIRESALEAAKKSLDSLRAVKDRVNEQGEAVEQPDHRIALRSPVSGTVVEFNATSGAHVETNQTLFRIIDLSRVWIRAEIYETDLPHVSATSGANVEALGLVPFEITEQNGRLLTIGEVVDPLTRTIPVVWEVSNAERLLKVGMLVQVHIRTGEEVKTLAIPESAVFQEENKSVVYVHVAGETFERRIVQIGIRDRGLAQILSGLSPGERVVMEGGYEVALASRSTGLPEAHVH
jgi:cobalt-zinc-cadmium efflux system membrane fusion protein